MAKDDEDDHRELLLWGRMKRTLPRVAHFPSSFRGRPEQASRGLAEACGGLTLAGCRCQPRAPEKASNGFA